MWSMFAVGSKVIHNDTLRITSEQGFPQELDLKTHQERTLTAEDFAGKLFSFSGKPGARIYHHDPVRCFLIEDRDGKWIYWGRILLVEQTIRTTADGTETSGKYKIYDIPSPEEQKIITKHMSPDGLSYF